MHAWLPGYRFQLTRIDAFGRGGQKRRRVRRRRREVQRFVKNLETVEFGCGKSRGASHSVRGKGFYAACTKRASCVTQPLNLHSGSRGSRNDSVFHAPPPLPLFMSECSLQEAPSSKVACILHCDIRLQLGLWMESVPGACAKVHGEGGGWIGS